MLRNPSACPRKRKKIKKDGLWSVWKMAASSSIPKPCYPCFDPRFPGLLARLLGVWHLWGFCLDSRAALPSVCGLPVPQQDGAQPRGPKAWRAQHPSGRSLVASPAQNHSRGFQQWRRTTSRQQGKISITHVPASPSLESTRSAGRGGKVLCAAQQPHHESLRLRTLLLGTLAPLPGILLPAQALGSAVVVLAPSLPLCRDAASWEMSHTLQRGWGSLRSCLGVGSEGRRCVSSQHQMSDAGAVLGQSSCCADPSEQRVPGPSSPWWNSFFPLQLLPSPAFSQLPSSLCTAWLAGGSPSPAGPDSQFELITDVPQAPPKTRRARGRQPPQREGSLLPQTHPVTRSDGPGAPPGISGGFLMQHSGRIFVPGFALNWFLKHTDIQAWASSFPACARAHLPVEPQSPCHSSSAPFVGSARRLADRNGTKTVDGSSVEGLNSSQDR